MNNEYKQGGTATLIKIAFRNIWRNKRRTIFCFAAVGMAVFMIIIYSGMIGGMERSIADTVIIYDTGHVRVTSTQYEAESEYMPVQYPLEMIQSDGTVITDWREIADSIKANVPGVREVLPRISTFATLQESTIKHATLWGLDIERETATNNLNMTNRTDGLIEGRWPGNANECVVGRQFIEKSGLRIGDRIPLKTVSAQFSDRIWSPTITGIFDFDYIKFDLEYIIVDFERLSRLLVMGDSTQTLVVFANDEEMAKSIATSIENLMGTDTVATAWNENYWVVVMQMAEAIYVIMFLIFITVASFLIVNTIVMIINERIKEIGMMGCLGMTRAEIVKVFFFESLFLAGFGALCGVIVGGTVVGLLSTNPIPIGEAYGDTFSMMPMSNSIFMEFTFGNLLMGWLMGVGVASVFTLVPSLKSAFVEPVEALRR